MKLKEKILEELRKVQDPELRQDVVSLKLVSKLEVDEEGNVNLTFRPTSFFCPIGIQLALMIKQAVMKVKGVKKVNVKVVDFVWAQQAEEYLKSLDQE